MLRFKVFRNNNSKSSTFGKYYGRAIVGETVDIDKLAVEISARCTVTDSDIVAVIRALVTSMTDHISAGDKVVLDKLGSFRAGISTRPADKPEEFTAANVVGTHIIYHPAVSVGANHKRVTPMIENLKVAKMVAYNDPPEKSEA